MRCASMDFKTLINTEEYSFLRTDPRLGRRIMFLGVSGSHGYGTSREGSDLDLRGVTLNLPSDLIGLTSFEQFEDRNTDTVIYSFMKLVNLLLNCNPNTIEILGLDDNHLNKHAMHLIRLFMMGIDILQEGVIRTHRPQSDLKLLNSIRDGDYMENGVMIPAFYDIVSLYEDRFAKAERESRLPENPDMREIERLVERINRHVVMEG